MINKGCYGHSYLPTSLSTCSGATTGNGKEENGFEYLHLSEALAVSGKEVIKVR